MKPACTVFAILLLSLAPALQALADSPPSGFNLFTLEGQPVLDSISFNAEIAANNQIDLPAYFQVDVPQHPRITRDILANLEGGALLGFMFTLNEYQGEGSEILESVQVTDVRVPLHGTADGEDLTRQQIAGVIARDIVFPRMIEGKADAHLMEITAVTIGEIDAAQAIGRHKDDEVGQVLLRIVVLPHPDQEESLMLIARINLALVPVRDRATLDASLSGRLISSWRYQ